MTATRPPVVSAEDFTVASTPRNQRASPSPGPSVMGAAAVAVSVMGGTLVPTGPGDHPRRRGSSLHPAAHPDYGPDDGATLDGRPTARRDPAAGGPRAAAPGVLRGARAAPAAGRRQRRDLLAHAGPAHAADDQRRPGRARRAGDLHARDGRRRRDR